MEYAEKHYVIPQNQLNKLRAGGVRETIQQSVENDLDIAIRNILQRTDLDPHGKVKLYSNVLQRFLTIVKQGDLESGTLTLTIPKHDADAPALTAPVNPSSNNDYGADQIVNEILSNVPRRSLKNVKYILDKMSNAKHMSSWTSSGEFVFKGHVINGSHVLDLVKSITAPRTIRDEYRPRGWNEFLDAFAVLNIPFSTISNTHVKRTVEALKRKTPSHVQQMPPKITPPLKKRMRNPSENLFNSPDLDASAWLTF